jgi:C4-dicarboxylate-specific signal transduction histidine kinase
MIHEVWKSRLASRLVKIFILLITLPMSITLLLMGYIGREQSNWMSDHMKQITLSALSDAGIQYRTAGRVSIYKASSQAADISRKALVRSLVEVNQIQKATVAETAIDISNMAVTSFDKAIQESLSSNHVIPNKTDSSSAISYFQLHKIKQQVHYDMQKSIKPHSSALLILLNKKNQAAIDSSMSALNAAITQKTHNIQDENSNRMNLAADMASSTLNAHLQPIIAAMAIDEGRRMFWAFILVMAISMAMASIWAIYLSGRIVLPIARLAQAARDIAQNRLDKRVNEVAPDEIGDLARSFNLMIESLEKSKADLSEVEAQLVQSAKLASLGTLSAGVAHELNQPVAIIRGLSQQLQSESTLTDEIKNDIKLIEEQTARMMKIINHLRSFSRMGRTDKHEVDVNQIIQNCFILVGEQLLSHHIEAELKLCPEIPFIWGDGNELEQVFLNLITNARDALEMHCRDAVKRIVIATKFEQGKVIIELRDNGPGIPGDIQHKIFDPFFTTKEPGNGTWIIHQPWYYSEAPWIYSCSQ